jgi:hypothetical protein
MDGLPSNIPMHQLIDDNSCTNELDSEEEEEEETISRDEEFQNCQGRAQGYRIRRALASARALCPFPEYCPVFHKG